MKDWLFEKVAALFGPKYIGATVRTLVAWAAGMLYGVGVDPEAVQEFAKSADPVLTSLITIGITWLWSMINKRQIPSTPKVVGDSEGA